MLQSLVADVQCISTAQRARELRYRLEGHVDTSLNLSLAFSTTLGGNQDNTIGTLHTINGCSGSILQYRDALHRADINAAHWALHTIYEYERVARVPRADTTNHDLRVFITWHTCRRHGDDTRQITSQGCTDARYTTRTLQLLTSGLGNRSHDRSLLLLTVTYDYDFADGVVIRKSNLKFSFLSHLDFLGIHTHVGNNQGRTLGRNGNGEVTIHIGDST